MPMAVMAWDKMALVGVARVDTAVQLTGVPVEVAAAAVAVAGIAVRSDVVDIVDRPTVAIRSAHLAVDASAVDSIGYVNVAAVHLVARTHEVAVRVESMRRRWMRRSE